MEAIKQMCANERCENLVPVQVGSRLCKSCYDHVCRPCKGSGQWVDEHGFAWRCNKCDGTGKK